MPNMYYWKQLRRGKSKNKKPTCRLYSLIFYVNTTERLYKQLIMRQGEGRTGFIWAVIWSASATIFPTTSSHLLSHIVFLTFVICLLLPAIINTNHLLSYSLRRALNGSLHAKLAALTEVIKVSALKQKARCLKKMNERPLRERKPIREVGSSTMAQLMRNELYTLVMYYWDFNRCTHGGAQWASGAGHCLSGAACPCI